MEIFSAPLLEELVVNKMRVHIKWNMKDDEKTKQKSQWCQGKVVRKGWGKDCYIIQWDAMSDCVGCEEETESEAYLDPSKWRTKFVNGWRLDLDVELFENYYDTDDDSVIDDYTPQKEMDGAKKTDNDELSSSSSDGSDQSEIEE